MRRVLLLLAVSSSAALAQPEAEVTAALAHAIAQAEAGEAEALASHLACLSGAGDAAVVRPCLVPVDSVRVAAVAAHLRATYTGDPPWVLDWLRSSGPQGALGHQAQVKVRDGEPPTTVEYRFVPHGDGLLLADAGPVRLSPPQSPPPASDEEAVQRTMEALFRLTGPDDGAEAAALMACPDREAMTIRRCDPADPADRVRAEEFRARIGAFLGRVGPTGWGFTGYRTKAEREGTWHVLAIGYVDGGVRGTAYAAFIEAGDGLALGDLAEWPD